jgi:hypothetical protein
MRMRNQYVDLTVLWAEKIVRDEWAHIQDGDYPKGFTCHFPPCSSKIVLPDAHAFHMHNIVVHGMTSGLPKRRWLD